MSDRKAPIIAGSQTDCFALIALRWNKAFPELVIAHGGGESMRKLTTAPHIIGIAFVRHEGAVAGMRGKSSDALDSNKLLVHPVCGNGEGGRELHSSLLLRHGLGLSEIRRMAAATLQRGIATGVLMFYSTSILGTAIRALVGT